MVSNIKIDSFVQIIISAVTSYENWWMKLYHEAPQHILIETGLICFIVWLLFIRRTVDPTKITKNDKLSEKEINFLIDTWEPAPIVPKLTEKQHKVADSVKVIS